MFQTRFTRLLPAIGVTFILVALIAYWQRVTQFIADPAPNQHFCSELEFRKHDKTETSSSLPQVRRNVVLATHFNYHQDVLFALAWTIERVMAKDTKLSVYAPTPGWNFDQVVREFGLYHGTTKDDKVLINDILTDSGDGGIDMVILGTCEVEYVRSSPSHSENSCFTT
jgi:hypothetical protein